MEKLTLVILKYKYVINGKWVFSSIKKYKKSEIWDKLTEFYKKPPCNKSDIDSLEIIKLPKQSTFPKFSNETPFKLSWDSRYIHNPKIKSIRWDGYEWQYKLENIGHSYNYQSESRLIKLNIKL